MADDLESFGIFGRNDPQRRVCFNPVRSIDQCAVHLAAQSGLGEAGTDICRDFGNRQRVPVFAYAVIR